KGYSPFGSGRENGYAYASNDPINHHDPSGHSVPFLDAALYFTSTALNLFGMLALAGAGVAVAQGAAASTVSASASASAEREAASAIESEITSTAGNEGASTIENNEGASTIENTEPKRAPPPKPKRAQLARSNPETSSSNWRHIETRQGASALFSGGQSINTDTDDIALIEGESDVDTSSQNKKLMSSSLSLSHQKDISSTTPYKDAEAHTHPPSTGSTNNNTRLKANNVDYAKHLGRLPLCPCGPTGSIESDKSQVFAKSYP
ncbi:MAG: hypothetical protein JAZ02_19375, partial [Candidatus Thiodiazotropha endolucinida]|nr:hypothetical protein [Candidatus Thiodiazotropha endolucinida]